MEDAVNLIINERRTEVKKVIGKIIAKSAMASAKAAAGTASTWNTYQPKEPVSLKKSKENK